MRIDDLKRIIKSANQLHKMRLFAKPSRTTGNMSLWIYHNYERKSLDLPTIPITSKTTPEEHALVRKAIEKRNYMEDNSEKEMSKADRKTATSKIMTEWEESYITDSGKKNAKLARDKFLEFCGDMPVSSINRREILKMMDAMKKRNYHINYIRCVISRFRTFCNWAEQRGYMDRVDTRKLLPPEQFGEVKALNEEELKLLAATPCEKFPDVKDLFMLGIYTAQRIGEIKEYTFSILYNKEIKARQGKTGKFIKIPLSENALEVIQNLKKRRESEGKPIGEKDKIFFLPTHAHVYRTFRQWLENAGIDRNRITLHNSRSTAISLLINKGVPESVTQELANHADPRMTARYYRQIDVSKKKEALDLIDF